MATKCPNCHNDTWLQLCRHRKWFTLFFIPVIFYSSKHLLMCEVCSRGVELKGEKIKRAKQMNELTQRLFGETITKDEYWAKAKEIELLAA
jgi:ribosomal protein S27E